MIEERLQNGLLLLQDDVRLVLPKQCQHLVAIVGFAYHAPMFLTLQDDPQAFAFHGIGIGDQNTKCSMHDGFLNRNQNNLRLLWHDCK